MDNNGWCKKIEVAIVNHNLTTTFNDFTESDWNNFIRSLIREELDLSIPEFAFDSPIVYFVSVFKNLNENSHKLIGRVIKQLLENLLLEDLNLDTQQDSVNSLFIAYAVPIHIGDEDKDIRLLKNIALEPNINSEIRTYAARLVANYSSVIDMSFWNELMETDYESTLAPIAIGFLSKQSSEPAVKFLKDLKQPLPVEHVDNFEISIRRLLEKIIDRKEESNFSLERFPNWSFDYIKNLVRIDRFKSLNSWIQSSQGLTTLVEHVLEEPSQIKHNLPPKNYLSSIENDETANNIQSSLIKNENYRIFMLGENKGGTGTTSRAVATGYYFVEVAKNVFNSIIFIGFNVKNIDEMLVVIKDNLNDEKIKKCSNNDENIGNIINSFEELHKIENKKTLIIIDDFHQKLPEQQKVIGDFIKKIELFCKVVIAMQNEEEEVQKILVYNSNLIPNSDKVYILPIPESLSIKEQKSEQEQEKEFLTQCYIGNPLAIKLALATTSKLTICPLPQEDKDPVWYSFQESFKELDDSSKKMLRAVSVFYNSKIFHDLALNQEALEYIVSDTIDKIQTENAVKTLRRLELISSNDQFNNFPSITIADSICRCTLKLENLQDIEVNENIIFDRLTEYYIGFVEKYGGSDLDNTDNFKKLEIEWYNILAVLEWNKKNHNFDKIEKIWFNVNRFADLYGHWEDRVKWLDVLMDHYKSHQDKNTYARCLSSKGWTLTMFGGDDFYQEAQEILREAWELEGVDLWLKSYIAHNLTVLYYQRGKEYFDLAKAMIAEQERIYETLKHQGVVLDDTECKLKRVFINCIRDKAKIEFLEGNYYNAYEKYIDCLRISEEINWMRMKSYFHYKLAATLLKQIESSPDSGKIDTILIHIDEGVRIAKNNNNRRRLAYFKELYASLLQQKGDSNAEYWDKKAKDDIRKLGLKDSSYHLAIDLY